MSREVETWTCQGRDINAKGKVFYTWSTEEDGEVLYYDKLRGSLGHTYEVEVVREPGNVKVYPDTLKWVGQADMTEEDLLRFRARDEYASSERARKSALTKAEKDPLFPELFQVLRAASTRMTRAERRALAVRIMEELYI